MANAGEEILDTRIKEELDSLNSASNSINKLENEVQRARATFKVQKEECTQQLMHCSRRVGKQTIVKSKEYYELLNHLFRIQGEVQKATQKFQKANSVYKAALETVSLAEEHLVSEDGGRVMFDGAWQDMLNHSNLRFIEAEQEKRLCEVEHGKWSREFEALKNRLSSLHRSNAKSIFKCKPFYEMKKKFESKLQAERQNAEDLQLALVCNKQKYRMALTSLERISEEIHSLRELRTPGVGAESDACSELSDSLTFNFDFLSDTSSQVSSGDLAEFDSELTFMDEWAEVQDQSLFSKVSTRFNRSTSLSNLGDRNRLTLAPPPRQSYFSTNQSQPSSSLNPQKPPHQNIIDKHIPKSSTISKLHPITSTTQHPLNQDFTTQPLHVNIKTSYPDSAETATSPPPPTATKTNSLKPTISEATTNSTTHPINPNTTNNTTSSHPPITSHHSPTNDTKPNHFPTPPSYVSTSSVNTFLHPAPINRNVPQSSTPITPNTITTTSPHIPITNITSSSHLSTSTINPSPNPSNISLRPIPSGNREITLEGEEGGNYQEPQRIMPPAKSYTSSAFFTLSSKNSLISNLSQNAFAKGT